MRSSDSSSPSVQIHLYPPSSFSHCPPPHMSASSPHSSMSERNHTRVSNTIQQQQIFPDNFQGKLCSICYSTVISHWPRVYAPAEPYWIDCYCWDMELIPSRLQLHLTKPRPPHSLFLHDNLQLQKMARHGWLFEYWPTRLFPETFTRNPSPNFAKNGPVGQWAWATKESSSKIERELWKHVSLQLRANINTFGVAPFSHPMWSSG